MPRIKRVCIKCGGKKFHIRKDKTAYCVKCRNSYLRARELKNPAIRKHNNRLSVLARRKMKVENPIHHKAMILGGGLHWGKGATKRMEEMLKEFLGKPCIFCGVEITLKNASLDHNIPITKHRKEVDSKLNNKENLHIICINCNRTKSNLTGLQFNSLLQFLDKDQAMRKIVLMKMRASNFMWRRLT